MANLRKDDILLVLDEIILDINKHMKDIKPRPTPSELVLDVLRFGLGISCIVCLNKECTCKPRKT